MSLGLVDWDGVRVGVKPCREEIRDVRDREGKARTHNTIQQYGICTVQDHNVAQLHLKASHRNGTYCSNEACMRSVRTSVTVWVADTVCERLCVGVGEPVPEAACVTLGVDIWLDESV